MIGKWGFKMKITVHAKDFKRAVTLARKVAPKKFAVPLLCNLAMDFGPAGLTITATDIDSFFRAVVPAESSEGAGRILIDAASLAKALPTSAKAGALISLEYANDLLKIDDRAGLTTRLDNDDLPAWPEPAPEPAEMPGQESAPEPEEVPGPEPSAAVLSAATRESGNPKITRCFQHYTPEMRANHAASFRLGQMTGPS